MEMNLVSLPNERMECASLFFFLLSFFNFRIVQLAMAALELRRDNKSVFEQENELSFFCACATIVSAQWWCDSVAKSVKRQTMTFGSLRK